MQALQSRHELMGRNWDSWAKEEGISTLPGENIKVTFADEFINPINIQVAISWTKKLKTNTITLATKLTK